MMPSQQLFDSIERSKVEQARQVTPQDRLTASLRHSDESMEIMRAGVRHRFPGASEEEVQQRLIDQVRLVKRMHERR
jgi:hypothetical protein